MNRSARPGGRTAQNRLATFSAAAELLAERGPQAISMRDIAERAGVAATSLYRRWGSVEQLLFRVAVEKLMMDHPLPDTGTVRTDLLAWAQRICASLRRPEGSTFFRTLLATAPALAQTDTTGVDLVRPRIEQIDAVLKRGIARGETVPSLMAVFDHLLAPLYMRALFGAPLEEALAQELVERLLPAPHPAAPQQQRTARRGSS